MRRFLVAAVLLSVTITPMLHLWCESSCAEDSEPSTTASCHHHHGGGGSAPAIAVRHDCDSHDAAPAILGRTSMLNAAPMMTGTLAPAISPSDPAVRVVAAALRPPDSSPPSFVSPLRL